MNIIELSKNITLFFEQLKPGLDTARQIGEYLQAAGSIGVQLVHQGKKLYAILFGQSTQVTKSEPIAKYSGLQPVPTGSPIVEKDEVAILIDITKRSVKDVAKYLDAHQIDANLLVLTNDPVYSPTVQFLNDKDPEEWNEIVRDFSKAMNAIQHAVGSVKMHVFIAAPVALGFGLGCMWGTVSEATVYHWDGNAYQKVLFISRKIKEDKQS